jgi:hypothetical protein
MNKEVGASRTIGWKKGINAVPEKEAGTPSVPKTWDSGRNESERIFSWFFEERSLTQRREAAVKE